MREFPLIETVANAPVSTSRGHGDRGWTDKLEIACRCIRSWIKEAFAPGQETRTSLVSAIRSESVVYSTQIQLLSDRHHHLPRRTTILTPLCYTLECSDRSRVSHRYPSYTTLTVCTGSMSQSEMELDDALADHAGPVLVHVDASRAIELPFEAWHFRRSATLHALVLGSMTALWIALPLISNGWQNLDLLYILCILMAIGMIAGRAAAHAWLEPVFAQKLVARLAFWGIFSMMALQLASVSTLTTADAQGYLSMAMIIIPMYIFLLTTFHLRGHSRYSS